MRSLTLSQHSLITPFDGSNDATSLLEAPLPIFVVVVDAKWFFLLGVFGSCCACGLRLLFGFVWVLRIVSFVKIPCRGFGANAVRWLLKLWVGLWMRWVKIWGHWVEVRNRNNNKGGVYISWVSGNNTRSDRWWK